MYAAAVGWADTQQPSVCNGVEVAAVGWADTQQPSVCNGVEVAAGCK